MAIWKVLGRRKGHLMVSGLLALFLAIAPASGEEKQRIENSGARHLSELLEIYVPGFQYMYNKWNGLIWGMRGVANDRNAKSIFLVNGHKLNSQSRDGSKWYSPWARANP